MKEKIINISKGIWDISRYFIIGMGLALFLNTFIIANSYVPTGSMEKTIESKSRIIGTRINYYLSEPKKQDIIIFHNPDNSKQYLVKRLIGTPGDIVEIVPDNEGEYGYVRVNGEVIDEPYLNESMIVDKYEKYTIPKDSYFFLGDNRNNSKDSRYLDNHYATRKQIIAKVLFEYAPKIKMLK